jgi:hypothetical protein
VSAAQDLFWLAHYTFNSINPLVEEAKAVEPTIQLGIDVTFGHPEAWHTKEPKVTVAVHWSRDGMLAWSPQLKTKADVDQFTLRLRNKVIDLKAEAQRPLEVGIPA